MSSAIQFVSPSMFMGLFSTLQLACSCTFINTPYWNLAWEIDIFGDVSIHLLQPAEHLW
jgi:hypothetical protein